MAQADGTIIIDTEINADGMKAGSKEVESAVKRMASSVDGLGTKVKTSLNKQVDSFTKLNNQFSAQQKKVDELKKKVAEYGNQKIPTDEYREIQEQIDSAEKKLNRLVDTQDRFVALGGKKSSNQFKRYQYDIDELSNTIKYARAELEDLEQSGKAFTFGNNTKQAVSTMQRLESEERKLADINNRLGTSYSSIKSKVEDYKNSVSKSNVILKSAINMIKNLSKSVKGVGTKVFTSFANGIKSASKNLLSMNKNTKRATMSLTKMLGMSILFSVVFRAISLVTGGMGEGVQNLAQYSDQMNRSISSMMSALTRLKNSFATAFNPILTVVSPVITRFINLLADAITYIGMFIARLTGQSTFVKAKKVQQDYAESLKDTADATKDAEKAAEDYLSPLDDINKYTEKNKSDSDKGSGAGELSPEDMFETVTIPDSIKNIADTIKDYIKNQDWEGLGKYLADGINRGLKKVYDAISWDNVGPKITPFINAFTQTFNSLVDNIDWDLLGRTIGTGINTLVNTLNLLIEGIDWKNLGTKLSNGFRGMITEINWTNLGNLLGNYFMISWDILSGFISDMSRKSNAGLTGFEELGTGIGNAVNGLFEKIDFGQIGTTLSQGINGAFETLKSFTNTVDWSGIAKNIYTGLNNMIHGINWTEAGTTLSQFATDLLGTIREVAENTDWEGLGKGIGDFLGSIDWVTIFSDVATIIYKAASGMLSGLFDSKSGTVFKVLAGLFIASKLISVFLPFGNAISEAITGQSITSNITTKVGTWFSTSVIPKILPAASSFLSSIVTWASTTFLPAIGTAISTIGAAILNPVGLTIVGLIIAGFLIWKNWDKITKWAGNVKDAVLDAFSKAKDWLKEKGEDIIQGLKDGYEKVKDGKFLTTVGKIKDEIFNRVGDVKTKVTTKGKNIIEGLKSGYDSVKQNGFLVTVGKIKDEIYNKMGDIKTKVTTKGKNVIEGLKSGYDSVKDSSFLSKVRNVRNEIFSAIGDTKSKVTSKGSDIIQGIKNGYNDKWSELKNIFSKLPKNIKDAIPDLFNTGKDVIKGFVNGIKSISIPLPHVKLGSGSTYLFGKKISYPTFSVSWYKKGGLFSDPSLIGVGEAGREAVLPLENRRTMRMLADSIVDNMSKKAMTNISLQLPHLASGAVIPANKEFMAVLGDQNKGNNIEAPESLIRRIVREESGGNSNNTYEVSAKVGRKELFKIIIDEAKMQRTQTGRNPFELA